MHVKEACHIGPEWNRQTGHGYHGYTVLFDKGVFFTPENEHGQSKTDD